MFDKEIPVLPVAFSIDMNIRNTANLPKPGGYGVMYKCPCCGNPFYALMPLTSIKYCYNCGQAIKTDGVVEFINSQMSDIIEERRREYPEYAQKTEEGYLKLINETLNPQNDGRRGTVFIAEFEKPFLGQPADCPTCKYDDNCTDKPFGTPEKCNEGHRRD